MHIRSRRHHRRLQISLIVTRRIDGEVRQKHVASLGSVPPDASVQDRVAFWTQVHPRLSRLDNRLDPATRGRVMGELHKLVPMVPVDTAVADKIKAATRNVKQSATMRDMFQETVAAKRAMVAKLQVDIAEGETHVANRGRRGCSCPRDDLRRVPRHPQGRGLDEVGLHPHGAHAGARRGRLR
jgi:hypothetical protein